MFYLKRSERASMIEVHRPAAIAREESTPTVICSEKSSAEGANVVYVVCKCGIVYAVNAGTSCYSRWVRAGGMFIV